MHIIIFQIFLKEQFYKQQYKIRILLGDILMIPIYTFQNPFKNQTYQKYAKEQPSFHIIQKVRNFNLKQQTKYHLHVPVCHHQSHHTQREGEEEAG